MRHSTLMTAAAAALLVPAVVIAQAQAPARYLPDGALDIMKILPPAPRKGEPGYRYDREVFKATRRLLATPRGAMAAADVPTDVPSMARDFACSLGVTMTAQNAPRTLAMLTKAGADARVYSVAGKDYFKRDRPYLIDRGKTCQAPADLNGSFDYPSGHTTWGWTWGLILAELAPDRATPILARARAFGESRIVCGVHNFSAVEAGRITASATLSVVHAQPAFQADFAAARAELTVLRASAPAPENCPAEAALVAQPIYLR